MTNVCAHGYWSGVCIFVAMRIELIWLKWCWLEFSSCSHRQKEMLKLYLVNNSDNKRTTTKQHSQIKRNENKQIKLNEYINSNGFDSKKKKWRKGSMLCKCAWEWAWAPTKRYHSDYDCSIEEAKTNKKVTVKTRHQEERNPCAFWYDEPIKRGALKIAKEIQKNQITNKRYTKMVEQNATISWDWCCLKVKCIVLSNPGHSNFCGSHTDFMSIFNRQSF